VNGRRGSVWFGTRRVGRLSESPPGTLHFAYDAQWLADDGFAVSLSLPLARGEAAQEATGYFEGLLPEAAVRQRIARRYGVAANDTFGLLLAIGGDCAGALSIGPADAPAEADAAKPEALDEAVIWALVRSGGRDVSLLADQPQRFSLAGAQEKQPVVFDGAGYELSGRQHPSTHILKFETVPRVCIAEYLANRMAGAIGLPVVETEFVRLADDAPMLRIRRFDRRSEAEGKVARLHQEDLLQALGLPSMLKYQREGGPSLAAVAALLRDNLGRPVPAINRLRDWQIFNCLIGNWDGHAKNLAICYPNNDSLPELAPFYDLVAIEFLNRLSPGAWSRDMAFAVGGAYTPERITRDCWRGFADELQIPHRPTLARLAELAESLPGLADKITAEFSDTHGHGNMMQRFVDAIDRRCRQVRHSVQARERRA